MCDPAIDAMYARKEMSVALIELELASLSCHLISIRITGSTKPN